MDNPKPFADSVMTIFRGNGVKVGGVLLACLLFTGFVAHWALMQLLDSKKSEITRLEKTVERQDTQIRFYEDYMKQKAFNEDNLKNKIIDKVSSLQDTISKYRYINQNPKR